MKAKDTKLKKGKPVMADVKRDFEKTIEHDFQNVQNKYPNKQLVSVICLERGAVIGWNLKEKN